MLEREKLRRDAVKFVNTDLLVPPDHLHSSGGRRLETPHICKRVF